MLIALAILPALTNAAPTMVNIGENDIGRGEDALGGGTHRQQNDTRAARQKRSISWIMTVVGQDCGQACEARGEQCTDGVWPILTRDAMDAAAAPYGLACGSYLRGSSFRNPMMMSIADGRRNCYWDAGNSSCESAATGASSRRFCPCEKEPLKYRCELQSAGLPSCVWKVLMAWILRLASPSAGQPHYTIALGTRAFPAKVEWTSGLVYRCVATTIAQATNIVISARGGTETSSAASTAG